MVLALHWRLAVIDANLGMPSPGVISADTVAGVHRAALSMLRAVYRCLATLDIECWARLAGSVQETFRADFHRVVLSVLPTVRRPLASIEIMAGAHTSLVMVPSTMVSGSPHPS